MIEDFSNRADRDRPFLVGNIGRSDNDILVSLTSLPRGKRNFISNRPMANRVASRCEDSKSSVREFLTTDLGASMVSWFRVLPCSRKKKRTFRRIADKFSAVFDEFVRTRQRETRIRNRHSNSLFNGNKRSLQSLCDSNPFFSSLVVEKFILICTNNKNNFMLIMCVLIQHLAL